MSARMIALAAIVVIALGIGLAIAVRGPAPEPDVVALPVRPPVTSPAVPRKFTAPVGRSARPSDPSTRFPIPAGGFASWTGREDTSPGDMEDFAREAGLRLPVALEQHRSTLLEERTADPKRLAELLGKPPTAEMLAAIGTETSRLHEATATAQVAARTGAISDEVAIRDTRAAEDAYRRAYVTATGITDAQFDRLFAPDAR